MVKKRKTKVLFLGASDFAVPALEALIRADYQIVAVITTPDEPAGRKQVLTPPPIKAAAIRLGIGVLQPLKLKDPTFIKLLTTNYSLQTILGIVASYGKIIPPEIINLFPKGILNIHPSLLPEYRGSSPIQSALLNGDEETGVTIIKIDEEVDHGPIVAKSEKRKAKNRRYRELHDGLARLGAELLIKILPDYLAGKIKPAEQDHSRATFTKKIAKEDGRIDWRKDAKQIYNQFRAFHVWPGIWTIWRPAADVAPAFGSKSQKAFGTGAQRTGNLGTGALKITDCKISESQPYHGHEKIYIGVVYEEDGTIYVPCAKGHLELLRVQLEGAKEMPIRDFVRGHGDFIGSLLR